MYIGGVDKGVIIANDRLHINNPKGKGSSDISFKLEDTLKISHKGKKNLDISNALGTHNFRTKFLMRGMLEESSLNKNKQEKDEEKRKLLSSMSVDMFKMEAVAQKYYEKHGTLDGITSEELSQGTTAIEYKDMALFEEVSKELKEIDRGEFKSDLEYYDAVLGKLFDSNLSDKAKKSIGGYVEHLKKESVKEVELSEEDSLSVQEIEKKLARIKENMNQDSTKINWDEILELNKKFTNIYSNYIK